MTDISIGSLGEESIYRGYAITRLRSRYNMAVAIILSCFFFRLLPLT